MDKQLVVWQLISRSLEEEIPVMLLYVIDSNGSSPGRKGFAMAVTANGQMEGSIGGGIMEHKFVGMAKEIMQQNKVELSIRKQIHDKQAAKNQSGMICSGDQTIFLYTPTVNDAKTIKAIINCLEEHKSALLQLSPSGLSLSDKMSQVEFRFTYTSDEDWCYEEKIGYKDHLYIIGAGHCSLALSKVMTMLGFYIHLYDDRFGLNTYEQNAFAHEKVLVKNYTDVKDIIPDDNNYVVVMTMGYRTDDVVIKALLDKPFKYFGILGSKKKIEKMFTDYKREGMPEEMLRRIHAPIGLQINSQTPEEIAISIAAEIIKVKNTTLKI
jgi:xanthine dehydrogenase accessory factor